jgi:Cys-tRNA synthase (O-phospho-L-seryl-tRNA:Cys-tRNA synthase)
MNKLETLKLALENRNEEIANYQINIDNYTRAINKINTEHADNVAIIEFRNQLADLLTSSKIEQLKTSIIRDVITDQLIELESD